MRYLYGDSTESDLQINYLAFLRQVIDCAVLLMKHKVGRAAAVDRRRLKEQETALAIKALEDLGVQVAQNYRSIANETTPIGRVMTAMVVASIEAIERESHALRASARADIDREVQDDRGDRMRCIAALETLLCAHDLPGAEISRDVLWRETPRANLNAHASYATAVLTLELPPSSILAGELRVDRLVEGLEVLALDEGGWIKKNHKLVPQKIGRYAITRVLVTEKSTNIRLRAEGGGGLEIDVPKSGDVTVERIGDNGLREPAIDPKQRAGFQQLADKLEAAVNALDKRTQLSSLEIDGVSILDHKHPHVLAQRLIDVVAPVVQTIAKHSRNPDELVLRRPLGDDRREEIFVTIKELAAKLEPLPPDARQVFAPLGFVRAETRLADASDEATRASEPAAAPAAVAEAPDEAPAPAPVAVTVKDIESGPVVTDGAKLRPPAPISVPQIGPPRIPPIPAPAPRAHGPTVELDDAADLLDVTPEPVLAAADSTKRHAGLLPRPAHPSEDVGAAVEAALDAISEAAQNIATAVASAEAPPADAAPTVIADLLKNERKPLPRALIIETGEHQPLAKPEVTGT